jgi:hypothetical protein
LERVTDNVVISEVNAAMYVVLNNAEKHVSYWEIVSITECIKL